MRLADVLFSNAAAKLVLAGTKGDSKLTTRFHIGCAATREFQRSSTMAMRKSMILIAAIATQCLVAGAAHAKQISVKLTQSQVATTCGSLIVSSMGRTGCKKSCGDGKTCGYSCNNKGKDCKGQVVQTMTGSPSGSPVNPTLKSGILDGGSSGLGTQAPGQAGRPAAPPPVQLR
jgi:hypothetical protein